MTENNDSTGYELLELVDYLTPKENVQRLIKREYPKPLRDTVNLRRLAFEPYETTPNGLFYKDEVKHAISIVN